MRRSTSFCLWYQIRNRSTSVLPAFQPKIYRSQNEFPKVVSQDINQKLTSNYEKDIASDELLLLSKYYFDGEVRLQSNYFQEKFHDIPYQWHALIYSHVLCTMYIVPCYEFGTVLKKNKSDQTLTVSTNLIREGVVT